MLKAELFRCRCCLRQETSHELRESHCQEKGLCLGTAEYVLADWDVKHPAARLGNRRGDSSQLISGASPPKAGFTGPGIDQGTVAFDFDLIFKD
jgi:hypothetical protein